MYIYIYMYIYSIYLAYNQLDTDNPSKVMRGRAGDLLLLLYLANDPLTKDDLEPLCQAWTL